MPAADSAGRSGLHRIGETGFMAKRQKRVVLSLLGSAGLFLTQLASAAAPPLPPPSRGTPTASDQTQIAAFVQYYAQQMSAAAHRRAMVRARRKLLAPLLSKTNPPSAEFTYDFGTQVANDFTSLLSNKKTALNAAITIGSISDISMQAPLQAALTNANPAVRYWGAKGMGNIFSALMSIGPAYQQAVAAVQQALAVETDPLVAGEMSSVLLTQNPLPPGLANLIAKAVARGIAHYQDVVPTNLDILSSLTADLAEAAQHGATLTDAQKLAAMNTLTVLMSDTAQYLSAQLLDRKQMLSAFPVINNAATAMNAITGTTNFSLSGLNAQSNPAAVLLAVNAITGSQGQAGAVQKLFPKVPIPHRISALQAH
ncbi:MAG: hypothetical protein ACP5QA_13570 [Phycisphaerae bacterium]